MTTTNRKAVLSRRPEGQPVLEDFEIIEQPIQEPGEDQVLIKVEHLSIDAFITTTLAYDGLHGQSELRAPVMALGTGRVLKSNFDGLDEGDAVFGPMGAQQYAVNKGSDYQKLPEGPLEPRTYLGALGLTTGLTAYAGMVCVGEVAAGDTVVVSAAAGAVGTVACQIARNRGARVIGIAGGPEKCAFLTEIGCEGAIDYKNEDVHSRLRELAPDGVNVFFDNVGGEILDNVLDNIAMGARVVICGAISQYANMEDVRGPKLYLRIPERNASMRGFTVDYYQDRFPEMHAELAGWLADGKLQLPEHIEEGIDSFPDALLTLASGGHRGKLLVAV
jgi:NADPH-dependent curcumin reductase CurA